MNRNKCDIHECEADSSYLATIGSNPPRTIRLCSAHTDSCLINGITEIFTDPPVDRGDDGDVG